MSPFIPGKFVWFEHLSTDVAKARAFYEALFGWRTVVVPSGDQPYSMIHLGEVAIGGYFEPPPGGPKGWMPYLSVEDVDAAVERALAGGASLMRPPEDYGGHGRAACIADPEGALLTLWKGANGDRPDLTKVPDGDWYWNELSAADPKRAVEFYERTFGHTHQGMDMGPDMGTYYILMQGETMRAGIGPITEPGQPSMWLPYVAVADCDASAEKARGLGAQVQLPPTDIPGVGRFAMLIDPLGAAVAVIKPDVAAQA
jgi:predicted enzyme related to lactoylglutathione lyase